MLSLIQEVISALTPAKRTHSVLLLGTESSGKTALCAGLARLLDERRREKSSSTSTSTSGSPPVLPVPVTTRTLGQNVVELETASTAVTVWDVGGSEAIRPMWKHYVGEADKIVYVIDSRLGAGEIEAAIDILLDVERAAAIENGGNGGEASTSAGGDVNADVDVDADVDADVDGTRHTKPVLVLATKMDAYDGLERSSPQLSYKMDDVAMAGRLEAVASAFTRKVDEKRERCGALFDVEYSIKCLPVSCTWRDVLSISTGARAPGDQVTRDPHMRSALHASRSLQVWTPRCCRTCSTGCSSETIWISSIKERREERHVHVQVPSPTRAPRGPSQA